MPSNLAPRDIDTLAFRQSRHGAIVVAPEGPAWTILDVNDAYLTLTHRTRSELLGVPLFEAFPESSGTTEDHGSHRIAESFRDALEGRPALLAVQRYDLVDPQAPGGFAEEYWQLSSSALRGESGAVVALLHEVQNVTPRVMAERENARLMAELELSNRQLQDATVELEAQTEELHATAAQLEEQTEEADTARRAAETAERQMQTVFAQAPAAVAVTTGPEHRFILANKGFERLVGRAVRIGGTFRDELPEIAEQGFVALLDEVFRSGKAYVANQSPARVDNGKGELVEGWFDFVYQPLLDADGRVTGILQQGINVTTGVAALRAAEAASNAKGEFLAVMSHELRTPLNALGGYLDLLLMGLRGPLTAAQRADLERMQRSHRHLLTLINDVLNFARIDAGHAEFDIARVDVGAVLRRVEELVSPQCAVKHIDCVLDVAEPSPIAAADEERLGQILLNLLSNAVKYTAAGGRIVASCTSSGDVVNVRVADTGEGIPAEKFDAIFDPFVQVGRKLNVPVEGVGLGLAISRALAEGMRGTLGVESTVGKGSTFTLTLPTTMPPVEPPGGD